MQVLVALGMPISAHPRPLFAHLWLQGGEQCESWEIRGGSTPSVFLVLRLRRDESALEK